ncbi:MAG: YtxH domain-containing protein [Chloroflexi bacterium]|nr:YtxH domain-containing protein [Chloroflexota bacterium]
MSPRDPWFVAGFLTGCAVGAAAVLLYAPLPGRELLAAIREHIAHARAEARAAGQRAEADVLTRYQAIRNAATAGPAAQTSSEFLVPGSS